MQVVLSAVPGPSRTHVEVDREGHRRTFWIWPDGSWVVACESRNEPPRCASSPSRGMRMVTGNGVLTLVIIDKSRMTTVPAPASEAMPIASIPIDSVPVFPSEMASSREERESDQPPTVRIVD